MLESWIGNLSQHGVPYNDNPSLINTLSDPVKVNIRKKNEKKKNAREA